MSFGAGLGKFKKVHQDHMRTVLEDNSGKKITVVHSMLPEHMKKQLEGMPTAFKDGGGAQSPDSQDDSQTDDQKPVEVNVNTTPVQQSPAASFGNQPVNAQVAPAQQSPNILYQDQTLNAPKAVSLEQKAIREQQAVDTAKGVQQANIEQGYNTQRSAIAQQEQEQINEVKKHADDFNEYIKQNPIDPKHYQENAGTGRRVSNAIGLLLGGFGQGLVGGSNPAQDYINAQIDRDIAAQRARVDTQKSVYGGYLDLYKDQQAAMSATKASLLDLYTHKAYQVAAQLGTHQAQAAADAFAAKSQIEKNQLYIDTAGRRRQLNSDLNQQPLGAADSQNGQAMAQGAPLRPGVSQAASDEKRLQNAPGMLGRAYSAVMGDDDSQAAKEPPKKDYYGDHILNPDAIKRWQSMPYEMKAKGASEQIPALAHQYNQAVQAEKGLQIVGPTMDRLHTYAKEGGISGRFERAAHKLGGLPVVGQGIEALWSGVGDSPSTRAHLADQQALLGSVSAALKGTNVGDASIHEIVNNNLPDANDTETAVEKKKENISHFIKMHTETGLLRAHGYSPE